MPNATMPLEEIGQALASLKLPPSLVNAAKATSPAPALGDIGGIKALDPAWQELIALGVQAGMSVGAKHDAPSTNPPNTGYMHGPGGTLSYPGVDPDVYSAIIGTLPGIVNQLPAVQSLDWSPAFEVLTGIGAGSGNEPTYVCDPAPIGGNLATAMMTYPFGLYSRQTRELSAIRAGVINNRADPLDLRLVNRWNVQTGIPGLNVGMSNDMLVNEMSMALWERAVDFQRLLSQQAWIGNPANNNAGGGYREMAGLATLLTSTQKDAITGEAVPALAPDIKDFRCANVESNGSALVAALAMELRYLRNNADRAGLSPVRWALAMRQQLFWALAEVWPCAYYTTFCTGGGLDRIIDVADQTRMRDEMRAGNFLLLDGIRYDVILDDGIPERSSTTGSGVSGVTLPSGVYCSDIYILPMSVQGTRSTLYLQYFPFDNQSVQSMIQYGMALLRSFGNGAWLETVTQTRACLQWQAYIQPRIVLRTPFLAGRLNNVAYTPIQHLRDPYPDDPYYAAGGTTYRAGPSFYNPFS